MGLSVASWIDEFILRFPPLLLISIVFIKNTILGTAVFDAYVELVEVPQPSIISDSSGGGTTLVAANISSSTRNAPLLSVHFAAGAIAGSLHSVLSLMFNSLESRSLPSLQTIRSSTLHHAVAHSVLFGFYQLTKRRITYYYSSFIDTNTSSKDNYLEDKTTGKTSVYSYEVASVAIAGGFAGVMQSVCSHYTGMWLHVDDYFQNNIAHSVQNMERHKHSNIYRKIASRLTQIFQPLPPLRSTVLIPFPIMAVAFLAFEYGSPD